MSEQIAMPSLAEVTRAVYWLQYFRSLVDQGVDFLVAEEMADERFGYAPPKGSLSEALRRGNAVPGSDGDARR